MSVPSRRGHPCPRSRPGAGSRLLIALRPLLGRVPLAAAVWVLAACGGEGGTTNPPVPPEPQVARVEVTAAAATVVEGESVQLLARAATTSGATVSGKTFTWQSSNAAVATVDGAGLVRGVAAGSATITAAENASGTSGTLAVTVTPPAVGTISVSAPQPRVKSGRQLQLSAVVRDGAGRVLTGREVGWSTSAPAVATVGADGVLVGRTPGMVTVTASSGGRSGALTVEVFDLPPVRITLTPALRVLAVGDTVHVRAVAIDAEGDTLRGPLPLLPSETRRAGAPVLAPTGEPGVHRAAALGHTLFQAEVGGVWSNTAVVAVLGEGELIATALPNGSRNLAVRPGDRITVPVILDMSRAGTPGDLGALELELTYSAAALELKSATPGVAGSISEGGTPGRYRFAFASTTPTPSARLTVVTLVFEVAADALPRTSASFTLSFPSPPASTGFAAYPQPVVVNGLLGIVAP